MDTTVGFPCLGTFGGYIDPNVALGGFDGERGEGRGGEGKGVYKKYIPKLRCYTFPLVS